LTIVPLPPQIVSPLLHGSTQVAKWVWRKSSSPAEPLPALHLDIATQVQLESSVDEIIVLEQAQFEEIQEFLADPTIISLFRLNFIRQLAPKDALAYLGEIVNLSTFQRLAQDWCRKRGQTWSGLAEHLWFQINSSQEVLVGRLLSNPTLTSDLSEALIDRFFFGRLHSSDVPGYIRLINELAQNHDRQQSVSDLLHDCARIDNAQASDEFLILGLQEDRAKFDNLYVDRTLVDAGSGKEVSAAHYLDIEQSCPRVVVIGDPGVGKSTLTSWIKWRLASSAAQRPLAPHPVLITLVSRYDLVDAGSTIMSAIRKRFETDFLVETDDKMVDYLAAMGWMVLIVDGLDEVSDLNQRRKIVDQITSIAEAYPALPVICTTRRTGFEVGIFRAPFTILQLDKYSENQVVEYAHKWFSASHSNLKAERFLGESRTLGDLITNPLLLALLCTLYRQYDYIPESRRELYLRCAALMFYEWDPRRGINIPNLFKREGEAILREIALILLRKGGVGASIDENQLLSIIKGHLEDKGIDSVAAVAAARELLEYCSRRAWILSKVSSKDRLDYFSFTHRTFFEFFAAEAIIRKLNHQHALAAQGQGITTRSGDLGPVSRTILDTFLADPTTVMPELLLQTADDLMGGMSTPIIDELLRVIPRSDRSRRADVAALCMRLVGAGGAHAGIVERVLDTTARSWSEQGDLTGSTDDVLSDFKALLNIAPAHRLKFITMCVNDERQLGRYFVQRYARLSIVGESGLYSDEWRECALTVMSKVSVSSDAFEIKYRWRNRLVSLEEAMRLTPGKGVLLLSVGDYRMEGILWDALGEQASAGARNKVWTRAYSSLMKSDDLMKANIGTQLVGFAERAHIAEGVIVPLGLSRVVAALMPRGKVGPWARATGHPDLLEFDSVILDLELAYRAFQDAKIMNERSKESSSRFPLKNAQFMFKVMHRRYYEKYKECPPRWLFDHLTPEYIYPYDSKGPFIYVDGEITRRPYS
jgi:hypothetical protein